MKVLVTGGMGYIGSHTCVQMIEAGIEPIIVDNLCNAKLEVLNRIEALTGKQPAL
ncbi:NAD-dependent epimerase/dehydratase family protein, partial [Vibrio sp. Y184]|uniref:NAD-dependent epimerase/dehydratase family protein n=1 Tax=Vibrio sp. Y184 TaxID=3074705 RepID=UPI002966C690